MFRNQKKEVTEEWLHIRKRKKKCNHWRASPSLHPCPTRRLDRKAPLVTMFTSCVCIRGNPERFAGRRGGFGCSSDAARHALDRGSCGTSLGKKGISERHLLSRTLLFPRCPNPLLICRVHTQSPCVYNRRLNLDQNLLVVHLLYCVSAPSVQGLQMVPLFFSISQMQWLKVHCLFFIFF